jgi:rSAM/selenodomain-associated transferase 2
MLKRRPLVSIIIPTFNEAHSIQATLQALTHIRGEIEVIVVDGGSSDLTLEIAAKNGAHVIASERGRGIQMHRGASVAHGEALLFLHADTVVPPEAADRIVETFASDVTAVGGNFDIRFDGHRSAARFLTWLYPQLGRLGLCYGDSGIFVRASTYNEVGGFKPFPIFEDLDLVYRIRRLGHMVHLPVAVVTSSRRFEGRNFTLAFVRWSILQALYWLGVHPRLLNQLYAPVRSASPKR